MKVRKLLTSEGVRIKLEVIRSLDSIVRVPLETMEINHCDSARQQRSWSYNDIKKYRFYRSEKAKRATPSQYKSERRTDCLSSIPTRSIEYRDTNPSQCIPKHLGMHSSVVLQSPMPSRLSSQVQLTYQTALKKIPQETSSLRGASEYQPTTDPKTVVQQILKSHQDKHELLKLSVVRDEYKRVKKLQKDRSYSTIEAVSSSCHKQTHKVYSTSTKSGPRTQAISVQTTNRTKSSQQTLATIYRLPNDSYTERKEPSQPLRYQERYSINHTKRRELRKPIKTERSTQEMQKNPSHPTNKNASYKGTCPTSYVSVSVASMEGQRIPRLSARKELEQICRSLNVSEKEQIVKARHNGEQRVKENRHNQENHNIETNYKSEELLAYDLNSLDVSVIRQNPERDSSSFLSSSGQNPLADKPKVIPNFQESKLLNLLNLPTLDLINHKIFKTKRPIKGKIINRNFPVGFFM